MNLDDLKSGLNGSQLLSKNIENIKNLKISNLLAIGLGIAATFLSQEFDFKKAGFFFPKSAVLAATAPLKIHCGFVLDDFHVFENEFQRGDILGKILTENGVAYPIVHKLVESAKGIFDITSMRIGKKYTFLSNMPGQPPSYLIYEPSPYRFVVFHLDENPCVEVVEREVKTEIATAAGVLETNFWQALTDNGLNDELADGMIDALSTSVDFYHQKVGDRFKVVYEKHFVEGKEVGTGKIIAAAYERDQKEAFAFRFEKPTESCKYFDFDGVPAKKAFLKSPVKFSRISSRFSMNRFHPILRYSRPHFGTDYAAPYGTPILAVADGVVEEATRRGGNGNFVKLRHDGTYESQYLHMQGFAKGIRPGARVGQGQTIGYVGSTGLATGPHVCFRFWKNGNQVDHTRLNLPSAKKMEGTDFEKFKTSRDEMMKMLATVPYRTQEEIFKSRAEMEKKAKVNP